MAFKRPSARMGTGGRRGRSRFGGDESRRDSGLGEAAYSRGAGDAGARTARRTARGYESGRTTVGAGPLDAGLRDRRERPASPSSRGERQGSRRSKGAGRLVGAKGRANERGDAGYGRSVVRGRSAERDSRALETTADEAQEEFISGRRAVMEALKSGRPINKILVQESASGGGLGELLALAREQSAVVQQVPKAKLDEVAKNKSHQGVLAYVAAKPYVELDDLIAIAKRSYPGLIVVLDGVEDPHNLGSVLRSVDGAGAAGVVIPKRRAVPLTGTVSKASAGALEHVEVARVANISQALEQLKKAGFWVMGAAGEAATLYTEVDLTGNIALVIGNEGVGLGKLVRDRCDALLRLPMHGQVNSLNAGVATGILLYEVLRQRAAKN